MINLADVFDAYSRQARLYPMLMVLFPALFLIISVPVVSLMRFNEAILSLALCCGFPFLLSDASRAAGKRIEPRLVQEWGGWPTTIMLRHSSSGLNKVTKDRYHKFLSRAVPGLRILSPHAETKNQAKADTILASAVHWLKERCRGPGYTVVLKENASYGFRRNMLGLKPYGVAISVIVAITALVWPQFSAPRQSLSLNGSLNLYYDVRTLPAVGIAIASIVCWMAIVRTSWVRKAADAYATSLLGCCDVLETLERSGCDHGRL